MTIKSLPSFLFISFGWAWGILGLYIFNSKQIIAAFGPITAHHSLFMLAVYALVIAVLCVVFWSGRASGVRQYLSRLLIWCCPPAWYAFQLVGIPLIYCAGSAVKGNLFDDPLWPDAQPYDTYFFALTATVIVWINCSSMLSSEHAVTEVIPERSLTTAASHAMPAPIMEGVR